MEKYYGLIRANTGTVLGGVRENRSIQFDKAADALSWLTQAMEANKEAGRDVSGAIVKKEHGQTSLFWRD